MIAVHDPSWQLVEVVGLPVNESWNGLFDLDQKQGLVAALGDPRDAALDRFRRGAPFYGWDEQLTTTLPAPPWVLADPKAMLKVMDTSMLEPLRQMIQTRAPPDQAAFSVSHSLPPVGDFAGAAANPATADFKPLPVLMFGAATDPLASLISGFGTAFEDTDIPPISLSDRKLFGDSTHSDWDFMVTARYSKGLDGRSDPIEYAAIVFAPGVAASPPVPANLATSIDGLRSPAVTDADWRGVVRTSWDKLPDNLPFRVGSYSFARAALAPSSTAVPLMDPRPYDPHASQPISASTGPDAQPGRLFALDERYAIASVPNPNSLVYGLAHQDLFGLWSAWNTVPCTLGEPPVRAVSILATRLDVSATSSGPCPATLVIELAWDWATRSPARIDIVGRLYAQAKLGEPPANLAVPAGVQTSLAAGPGFMLTLDFSGGDAPVASTGTAAVTATVQFMQTDGKSFSAGPVLTRGPRRYRLTVTGFSLDFTLAGRIGFAPGRAARSAAHLSVSAAGAHSRRSRRPRIHVRRCS